MATHKKHVSTNDPQEAELEGIAATHQLILKSEEQDKRHNILCDCKSAVEYAKQAYPHQKKYSDLIQQIAETRYKLTQQGKTANIIWIPGHAGNPLNDKADELAKEAAQQQIDPAIAAPRSPRNPDVQRVFSSSSPAAAGSSSFLPSHNSGSLAERPSGMPLASNLCLSFLSQSGLT